MFHSETMFHTETRIRFSMKNIKNTVDKVTIFVSFILILSKKYKNMAF